MELSLRSVRTQDGIPNIHHHRTQKINSNKESFFNKPESNVQTGFPQKKQCRYPEDPNSIDTIRDETTFLKLKQNSKSMGRKQGLLWTQHRDQANMNQYEINTSNSKSVTNIGSTAKQIDWQTSNFLNSEYSYAYCEPIIKKSSQLVTPGKISNIPTSLSSIELCKTHKSGNSLRALLTKSFRKSTVSHPEDRHTYTTKYGKKENIYEEVDKVLGQSGAKPKQSFSNEFVAKVPFDEELKFVELQHNRVINELSLSIEELLMPSQREADQLELRLSNQTDDTKKDDNKQIQLDNIRKPETFFSTQIQYNPSFDMDSGISGSSSSATSYAGSVRYKSNFTIPSTSRNSTVYEKPRLYYNKTDQNLSPFHLIADNKTNTKVFWPLKDQYSSYCIHLNNESHSSTNFKEPEKHIETISEKVILWNKMKMKKTSSSTKCSNINKTQQNSSHEPT